MAKISKKRSYGKRKMSKSSGRIRKKGGRSRTMKKAKRGGSMEKMMADSNTKPRKVYCFKCKRKVNVTKYEINQNSRGAYQVAGECGNHPDSNKPVKVFGFIKASDV